jgi:pyruvate/2-oxoglutarate dehydrogenase complex dihydrolipoamide dehydrogenase (E3) component
MVIGAGQAAAGIAVGFAKQGEKVALIEGDKLGGTCLNYGCRPTKTLRASALAVHNARTAGDYGIKIGEIEVDFKAVMARMHSIIGGMQNSFWGYMDTVAGLDIHHGYGHFVGKNGTGYQVQVNDTVLEAERIYINTGTRSVVPPIPGLNDVQYLTNIELLNLEELPRHLIVIGGGYIGLEFGQIFRRLGSDVTVIEGGNQLLGREDADIVTAMTDILQKEGLHILTEHRVMQVAQTGAEISVTLEADGQQKVIRGSHLLVATGRRPNSDTLNLDAIGLAVDARGFIPTNGKFETALPNIWALGDVNGRGAFTHTSYQDYEIFKANLNGEDRTADDRLIGYAVFVDPPYGRVGMNEKEARTSGKNVLMAVQPMSGVSRARLESRTDGLIKLLVDADTEQFLGASMLGMEADEVIQVISYFMHTGASYKIMQNALPVHPTVSEFFPTILGNLKPLV